MTTFKACKKRDSACWSQARTNPRNGKKGANEKAKHYDF